MAATCSWGGELTGEEKAFLDQHASDVVKTEFVRLDDPAVVQVFATPIYRLGTGVDDGERGGGKQSVIVARREDKLVCINQPGTDGDYPAIQKMFRPDFRLKNDEDAQVLQAAFDVIYPVFGSSDKEVMTFKHAGHQWTFVRGKYFDSLMGFVLTTNNSGTVTGVKYVLKLP